MVTPFYGHECIPQQTAKTAKMSASPGEGGPQGHGHQVELSEG